MSYFDKIMEVGDLLIVETGEYDDFGYDAPLRMVVPMSRRQIADAYLMHWRRPKVSLGSPEKKPPCKGFRPWIIAAGFAVEVPNFHTWHIGGCYGDYFCPDTAGDFWAGGDT
jgi:hypothetical protein